MSWVRPPFGVSAGKGPRREVSPVVLRPHGVRANAFAPSRLTSRRSKPRARLWHPAPRRDVLRVHLPAGGGVAPRHIFTMSFASLFAAQEAGGVGRGRPV